MLAYIGRRALLAIFTVWAISVLSFVIIQLPPGDYVTSYIAQMASMGSVVTDEEAQNLRIQYGLGQPIYVQYLKWMRLIAQGNFGMSMEWRRPVTEVIGERFWLTVVVSLASLFLTWVLALPIGIYSAVRQYSVGDYVGTVLLHLVQALGDVAVRHPRARQRGAEPVDRDDPQCEDQLFAQVRRTERTEKGGEQGSSSCAWRPPTARTGGGWFSGWFDRESNGLGDLRTVCERRL